MSGCIFCKIVAGEIPCYRIYEDDLHLGFLDISQVNDGHVLLIPKQHCRWIWDIANGAAFFEAARTIARAMQVVTGDELVSPFAIGEEVPHAHLHIIPAGSQGSMKMVYEAWNNALGQRKLTDAKMQAIADRYRNTLGGV